MRNGRDKLSDEEVDSRYHALSSVENDGESGKFSRRYESGKERLSQFQRFIFSWVKDIDLSPKVVD